MSTMRVLLFAAATLIVAGCQTTSSETASMVAPTSSPEAAGLSTEGASGADTVDVSSEQDPNLPEGARMLAEREDPTALGGDPDEVVCKNSGNTGSRISKKRTCMTRAEWRAMQDRSRQGMDQFKNDKGGLGTLTN